MATPAYFSFSTDTFPEADRFEAYRQLYAGGSEVSRIGPDFYARVRAVPIGRIVAFERHLNAVAHARPLAQIRRDGFEHFTVQLNVAGQFQADVGDGLAPVLPGEVILFDMTRPMRTIANHAHLLTFSIGRELVESATSNVTAIHGLILQPEMGNLLADYMGSLVKRAHTLSPGTVPAATLAFIHLLGAALGAATTVPARSLTDASREDRARRYIEQNLGTSELSPDQIALATGLSRSTLYVLFRTAGGVSKYIQTRRLAHLRAALSRPLEYRSVAQLCYDAGFSSESHASRAFRQLYGIAPGQFRASLNPSAPALGSKRPADAFPPFQAWVNQLQSPHAVTGT